jgi:hypothetical protein
VPGRIEYLPQAGTFLWPGRRAVVTARFVPDDPRRYTERIIVREVDVLPIDRPIPGRVEAEDHDATQPGEWSAYRILASATSSYVPTLRIATIEEGRKLRLMVDGGDVSGEITLPNTGGFQSWQTVTFPEIALEAGYHRLEVHWVTSVALLDHIDFNFPDLERYDQDFDVFANGATEFGDGSLLASSHLGTAAQVLNGALQMTSQFVSSTQSTFTLPSLGFTTSRPAASIPS